MVTMGRNVRKLLGGKSDQELAIEYSLIINSTERPSKLYSANDIMKELERRHPDGQIVVGLISDAQETIVMCGGEFPNTY